MTLPADNTRLAILAVLIATLSLSFGDAVIKSFSTNVSLWQLFFCRSLIAIPILLILIRRLEPALSLRPRVWGWTLVRSLLLTGMWIAYYLSLPHIPLSIAAAVYYTIPLFITLFSAWLTQDPVGGRSWLAVVVGFSGVLVIIRPDASGFNGYVLLPLLAAVLYACAMILTRTRCINEAPMVLSLILNVTFSVVGLIGLGLLSQLSITPATLIDYPFLVGPWKSLGAYGWGVMAILGVVIILGSLFAAIAYQRGRSSVVAAFDYFYLPFSLLWGMVFFSEFPDAVMLTGIALIAAGGLITVTANQNKASE